MSDITKLMVKVSKLYYQYGMSQKDIASRLNISRGYVCQLLDRARTSGIVEISIKDCTEEETDLEHYACELFGLEKAIIVSTPNLLDHGVLTSEIVNETCKYLNTIIESNMIIAFSWGSTVYQISANMVKHMGIKNITTIPLCGGTSNLEKKIYVSEISSNIAEAYNGTPLHIPLPAIVQNADIKRYICSDANINSIMGKIKDADIALFTVGSFGTENALYMAGYIDDASLRRLREKEAVGDLCAHFINEYGEICDEELDERTISIDLDQFSRIKNKVCVATGIPKVKALMGVLRKKYVDVLITDEITMQSLLKLI